MSIGDVSIKKAAGAVGLSGVLTFGGLIALLDGRYASAGDVNQLTDTIIEYQISKLEHDIKQCDRRISRVQAKPEAARTAWDIQDMQDAENDKEFYIRQLDRMLD